MYMYMYIYMYKCRVVPQNLNYLLQLTCTYTYILCMYMCMLQICVVDCTQPKSINVVKTLCDALQHILHTLFLCYHTWISPSVSITLFDVLLIPQGILDAYQYTLHNVKLHGPTNFSSFLDTAMRYASVPGTQQSQSYFILLVITVSTAGYKSTCRSCSTMYMGMYLFAHEDMCVVLHVHVYMYMSGVCIYMFTCTCICCSL